MDPYKQFIERVVERGREVFQKVSERSRTNVNRHTVIILSVCGGLAFFSYVFFLRPPSEFPTDKLVEIPEGMPLSEISNLLKKEHVVRSAILLRAAVFVLGYERDVQFGDYLFPEPQSLFSVARSIGIGAHGLEPIRIRVAEGATTKEMAARFGAHLERFNEERFLKAAQPVEGYLFPDTYFFLPNANDDLVLRTLRQNFNAHIESIKPAVDTFGKPLEDVIIMASILEREARNAEDMRIIAGVLWKRLDRGMLLQVDATFLYTLGKGTFDLTTADLVSDDPYNTYVHKGLPPGPIGSPSLDAILAAVTPIDKGYLFYLADKNSVTHYSKTYEEHLKKKRLYLGS